MAAINLRIKFEDLSIKTFRFALDAPLGDLLLDIKEKVGGDKGARDHGLFQPSGKETPARWLRSNRTLKYYGIVANVRILSQLLSMCSDFSPSERPKSQVYSRFSNRTFFPSLRSAYRCRTFRRMRSSTERSTRL
jgi:hypothetical protein